VENIIAAGAAQCGQGTRVLPILLGLLTKIMNADLH
jgi:hypothetical protein